MRIPISGGPPEVVLESKTLVDFGCSSQRAGRCLVREDNTTGAVFSDFDPLTGRGRELYRAPRWSGFGFRSEKVINDWSLSPDGSRIAMISSDGLQVVSLGNGNMTRRDLPPGVQYVAWSVAGDGLFLSQRLFDRTNLLRLDLNGSVHILKKWDPLDCLWVGLPSPSPDGKHIAFTELSRERNAWLLEGF
jgi:hypothetical protein